MQYKVYYGFKLTIVKAKASINNDQIPDFHCTRISVTVAHTLPPNKDIKYYLNSPYWAIYAIMYEFENQHILHGPLAVIQE